MTKLTADPTGGTPEKEPYDAALTAARQELTELLLAYEATNDRIVRVMVGINGIERHLDQTTTDVSQLGGKLRIWRQNNAEVRRKAIVKAR